MNSGARAHNAFRSNRRGEENSNSNVDHDNKNKDKNDTSPDGKRLKLESRDYSSSMRNSLSPSREFKDLSKNHR